MRSKKGFTLIELLAVIVILAVIALIATPIIMNVINDSKKGAAKDAMYGYVKAVELAAMNEVSATVDAPDGQYTTEDGNLKKDSETITINFKGTKPKNGGEVLLSKGNVASATLEFDGVVVSYNGKEANIGEGSTPTPSGPYAAYAYDPDLVTALESGVVSIAPESDFTMNNGYPIYNGPANINLVVPTEINGEKVTKIKFGSFGVALKGISLPNTVTHIETYTFQNQNVMQTLVLPPSITQLENWIFDGATALNNIKFTGKTVPTINEGAMGESGTFRGLTLSGNTIYVPVDSLSAYQTAFAPSLPSSVTIRGY